MLRTVKNALKPTPLDMAHRVAKQALQRSDLMSRIKDRVEWPYRRFLVSHPMRFIFAPLPKVASGNIKRWMLLESGIEEADWEVVPHYGIHPFAHAKLRVDRKDYAFDDAYFKAVFVRHPHRRLVSAFLDKFVLPYTDESGVWAQNASGRPLLSWLVPRHGYVSRTDVTFHDFARFVVRAPDTALDVHWLPQVRMLGAAKFDFVGKLERFGEDFARMREAIGSTVDFETKKARLPYEAESSGYAGDRSISELLARDAFPRWTDFYRPEIARKVAERFAEDFERFDYDRALPG